jgi:protein TonB
MAAAPAPAAPEPPPPPAAPPSGAAVATWEGQLAAHLSHFKRFPPEAQRRGEQGVVLMRITLGRNGDVLAMSMARSSGFADLDDEAEAWIRRATPLPPIPPDIAGDHVNLVVPLRFTLR